MANENTNDQQSHSSEQTSGFWKRHGRTVGLVAAGAGIAAAGVAVGIAVKSTMGTVSDLAETASENLGE